MKHVVVAFMVAAGPFVGGASPALADGSGDPAAVKNDGGKYYDKEGNPTFKVQSDGTVDWFTYSGFPPLSLGLPCVMVPTAKDRVTPRRSVTS